MCRCSTLYSNIKYVNRTLVRLFSTRDHLKFHPTEKYCFRQMNKLRMSKNALNNCFKCGERS
jgi:alpha-D-ribose 1-methylphosphonate 5-triphosphate diphosphatase PhnM